MRRLLLLALLAAVATPLSAQPAASSVRAKVDAWRRAHEREILDDAFALLVLPNVASDSVGIARNVAWLTTAFARRGVTLRALRAPSGGNPALVGRLNAPRGTRARAGTPVRTVVFYAHYDGQPVAGGGWDGDPFTPELRRYQGSTPGDQVPLPAPGTVSDPELRIRARSASDDKGPIIAMLAALDAMRAGAIPADVDVIFFFEGEEEAGSNHLGELLRTHKAELTADAWLFFDGPMHVSGAPQLVLGVRGVVGADVTFYGPNRPLHSGHYGNWAPNPAVAAAHFIASVRDQDGRIRIAGFYDDVPAIADADRAAAKQLSVTDDSVRRSVGLGRTEANNAPLGERIMAPALNIRGIRAGATGAGAANAVPTSASVSIDFRLVPDQQPARIRALLAAHLQQLGYTLATSPDDAARSTDRTRLAWVAWDSGYTSVRVAATHPAVVATRGLMAQAYGREPYVLPILGGSLPLFHFVEKLGATVITVPIVNADNSQHAPNENLRLQNLWDGIGVMTELMSGLGRAWPATPVQPIPVPAPHP